MPRIQINHFIAYLSYNNNQGALGYEETYPDFEVKGKAKVDYSTDGRAVFCLRHADFIQKLKYYRELQRGLIEEFGHGFSLAFSADSDCADKKEMAHFCKFIKALDPTITTVIYGPPKDFIDKADGLTSEWQHEPNCSSPLLSDESVPSHVNSMVTKLLVGVDYVSSELTGNNSAAKLVNKILSVDVDHAPKNDYRNRDFVRVDKKTSAKIQKVADYAFEIAMSEDVAIKPGSQPS